MMKRFFAFVFLFFITGCALFNQTRIVWVQSGQEDNLVYVRIDGLQNAGSNKMAVIQHGLASNMNHVAVQSAKKAFLDNGYVVVSFDGRYSLGKGNNDVEKASLTSFNEDLKSVIKWTQTQMFYGEPFVIVGHSLGGASVIEYADNHPELVDALIPITPVINSKSWEKSCMTNMTDFCKEWKQKGTYEYTDPDNHKKAIIPYSIIASCDNYDANNSAKKIKAKTLLVGAEKDIIIDPKDLQNLSKKFDNGKAIIIKSADHNFSNEQNQSDLYQAIDLFLKQ